MPDGSMNLAKYISAAGALSRRAAAEAVKAGRVTLNGTVVLEPGVRAGEGDRVFLDGRKLKPLTQFHYIMLHKPRGYVCTADDVHAEKKALDLIRLDPPVRLASAGRLDKESEGLLIFSNDGAYLDRLTHPRYQTCKEYVVTLAGELSPADRQKMREGVEDEGDILRVISVRPLGKCRYALVLQEGKKREIRRMTAALGAKTLRLKRVAVGALQLGTLPCGSWKELTSAEREASLATPGSL